MPNRKFKIGDMVIIDNLDHNVARFPGVNHEMEKLLGEEAQVREIQDNAPYYRLAFKEKLSHYSWHEDWLRLVDQVKKKKVNKKAITKEVIKEKLTEAKESLKQKASSGSVCSYSIIYKTLRGELRIKENPNDVCHARLRYLEGCDEVLEIIDWKGLPKVRFREDLQKYKDFANYMFNRSPYAHVFKTKRAHDYFESGVLVDVGCSGNEVYGALVSLRYLDEYKSILPFYSRLVRNGVHEGIAFVLSTSLRPDHLGNYQVHVSEYHTPISSNGSLDKLMKFWVGKENILKGGTPYSLKQEWNLLYKFSGGASLATFLQNHKLVEKKGTGWEQKKILSFESIVSIAKELENKYVKA